MLYTTILGFSASLPLALAVPAPVTAPNDIKDPTPPQIADIQLKAGGSLPNGPLPSNLTDAGTATLQLIALNEIFEVSYFNDLLHNITVDVTGYDVEHLGLNRRYVTKTIDAVLNVSLQLLSPSLIYVY